MKLVFHCNHFNMPFVLTFARLNSKYFILIIDRYRDKTLTLSLYPPTLTYLRILWVRDHVIFSNYRKGTDICRGGTDLSGVTLTLVLSCTKTCFLSNILVISKLLCTYSHSRKKKNNTTVNTHSHRKLLLCIFHTVKERDKVNLSSSNMVPLHSCTHGTLCKQVHVPVNILKDYIAAV